MKVDSQGRHSNTYQLSRALSHSSSTRPLPKKWTTDTSTASRGTPRRLPTFSMARCIRSSANKRLLQTERHFPINISPIAEISHWGYPSTGSPHSNAEVILHGQLSYSTITSPPTSRLTLTISSATASSLAPSLSRMSTLSSFPFTTNSRNCPRVWMAHLT